MRDLNYPRLALAAVGGTVRADATDASTSGFKTSCGSALTPIADRCPRGLRTAESDMGLRILSSRPLLKSAVARLQLVALVLTADTNRR